MGDIITASSCTEINSLYELFIASNPVKSDINSFINSILNEHFEWLSNLADRNNISTFDLISAIEFVYSK